jgi:hypothetical protein
MSNAKETTADTRQQLAASAARTLTLIEQAAQSAKDPAKSRKIRQQGVKIASRLKAVLQA